MFWAAARIWKEIKPKIFKNLRLLPGEQVKLAELQLQGTVSLLVVVHFTVLSETELLVVCPFIHWYVYVRFWYSGLYVEVALATTSGGEWHQGSVKVVK